MAAEDLPIDADMLGAIEEPGTLQKYLRTLAATGVRVGAPVIGGIAGGALGGVGGGIGAIPGAMAGGAAGGALGEVLADYIEGHPTSGRRMLISAGLGAVPGEAMISAGRPIVSGLKGLAIGGAGTAGNKWAEGKDFTDIHNYGAGDLINTLFGGAVGAGIGKFSTAAGKAAAPNGKIISNGVEKPFVELQEKNPVRIAQTPKEEAKAVDVRGLKVVGGMQPKGKSPFEYGPLTLEETLDPKRSMPNYAPASKRPHPKLGSEMNIEKFATQQAASGDNVTAFKIREAAHNTGKAGLQTEQKLAAAQDVERKARALEANKDVDGAMKLRQEAIDQGIASTTTSNRVIQHQKELERNQAQAWTQEARNENAAQKFVEKEATQEARNLNARDKFIEKDSVQQARNENAREKAQSKLVDNPVNQAVNESLGRLAVSGKDKNIARELSDIDSGIEDATKLAAKNRDFNAKFEAAEKAKAEQTGEEFLQSQFEDLDRQLVEAQRAQAARQAATQKEWAQEARNENVAEKVNKQLAAKDEIAANMEGLERGEPSIVDRTSVELPDGSKRTMSTRYNKPVEEGEGGGGTGSSPAPTAPEPPPVKMEEGPTSTIYGSKDKALIAQGQRGAAGIVQTGRGQWRLVFKGEEPKVPEARPNVPKTTTDAELAALDKPLPTKANVEAGLVEPTPAIDVKEGKALEDMMASQGITAGAKSKGGVRSPEGVVLDQQGQATLGKTTSRPAVDGLTKAESDKLAPVVETTSNSGPWNRAEIVPGTTPKTAPSDALIAEKPYGPEPAPPTAPAGPTKGLKVGGKGKIAQADELSSQGNVEAPKPVKGLKVSKRPPEQDTSKMTEEQVRAYYKARAPYEDVERILNNGSSSEEVKKAAQALLDSGKKPSKDDIRKLRDMWASEAEQRSREVGEPAIGTEEWQKSQEPYGPNEPPDPASVARKPYGPQPPPKAEPEGGTVLGSGLGGGQGIFDLIARHPTFATHLATGAGGAMVGANADDEDPLRGALLGGMAGLAAPTVGKALLGRLSPGIEQGETGEAINNAINLIPDYYRANLLYHPTNLPFNAWVGPWGSGVMAGLEHKLAGDSRGDQILQNFRNIPEFMRNWGAARDEARELLEHSVERWEGSNAPNAPKALRAYTEAPGVAMTAGDVTARNGLMDAGLSEEEARRITLTSEPSMWLGRMLSSAKKGAQSEGGKKSIISDLLLPFYRTAANQAEQSLERTPGIGTLVQKYWKDSEDPAEMQKAQQVLGGGVGTTAYLLGRYAPIDNPAGQRIVNKFLNNVTGQYGVLASTAFKAGLAARSGKSVLGQLGSSVRGGDIFPLPTGQGISDILELMDKAGNGKLKPSDIPSGFTPGGAFTRPNVPLSAPWTYKMLNKLGETPEAIDSAIPDLPL